MAKSLDEQYFTWLYSHVGSVNLRNRAKSYWSLTRCLYQKEFVWIIPNDDNRVQDGKDLRIEFLGGEIDGVDPEWLALGCSMFEMLVALSRRLAFEAEGELSVWFWHLIETLELKQYNDLEYDDLAERKIDAALDRVIWRTYSPDGKGGLFPLNHATEDQREVEIWYQLSAFLLESL